MERVKEDERIVVAIEFDENVVSAIAVVAGKRGGGIIGGGGGEDGEEVGERGVHAAGAVDAAVEEEAEVAGAFAAVEVGGDEAREVGERRVGV